MARTKKQLQQAKQHQQCQCGVADQVESVGSESEVPVLKNSPPVSSPNVRLHRLRDTDLSSNCDNRTRLPRESASDSLGGAGAEASDWVGPSLSLGRELSSRNSPPEAWVSDSCNQLEQVHQRTASPRDQAGKNAVRQVAACHSRIPEQTANISVGHLAGQTAVPPVCEGSQDRKSTQTASLSDCKLPVLPDSEDSQQINVFPTLKAAVLTLPKGDKQRVPVVVIPNVKVTGSQQLHVSFRDGLSSGKLSESRLLDGREADVDSSEEMDANIFDKFQQDIDLLNLKNKSPKTSPKGKKNVGIDSQLTLSGAAKELPSRTQASSGTSVTQEKKKSPRQKSTASLNSCANAAVLVKKSPVKENSQNTPPASCSSSPENDPSPPQSKRSSRLPSGSSDTTASDSEGRVSTAYSRGEKRLSRPSCRLLHGDMLYPQLAGRRDSLGSAAKAPSKPSKSASAVKTSEEAKSSNPGSKLKCVKTVVDSISLNPQKLENIITNCLATTKVKVQVSRQIDFSSSPEVRRVFVEEEVLELPLRKGAMETDPKTAAMSRIQDVSCVGADWVKKPVGLPVDKATSVEQDVAGASPAVRAQSEQSSSLSPCRVVAETVSTITGVEASSKSEEKPGEEPASVENSAPAPEIEIREKEGGTEIGVPSHVESGTVVSSPDPIGAVSDSQTVMSGTSSKQNSENLRETTTILSAPSTPSEDNFTTPKSERNIVSASEDPSSEGLILSEGTVGNLPGKAEMMKPTVSLFDSHCHSQVSQTVLANKLCYRDAESSKACDSLNAAPESLELLSLENSSKADDVVHRFANEDNVLDSDDKSADYESVQRIILCDEVLVTRPLSRDISQRDPLDVGAEKLASGSATGATELSKDSGMRRSCCPFMISEKFDSRPCLLNSGGCKNETENTKMLPPSDVQCSDVCPVENTPCDRGDSRSSSSSDVAKSQDEFLSKLISRVSSRVNEQADNQTEAGDLSDHLFGAEPHSDPTACNPNVNTLDDLQNKTKCEEKSESEPENTSSANSESLLCKAEDTCEVETPSTQSGGADCNLGRIASTECEEAGENVDSNVLSATGDALAEEQTTRVDLENQDTLIKSGADKPTSDASDQKAEISQAVSDLLSVQSKLRQFQDKTSEGCSSPARKAVKRRHLVTKEPRPLDVLSSVEMPTSKLSPFLSNSLEEYLKNPHNRTIIPAKRIKLYDDSDSFSVDSFSSYQDDGAQEKKHSFETSSPWSDSCISGATSLRKNIGSSEVAGVDSPSWNQTATWTPETKLVDQTCQKFPSDLSDIQRNAREEEDSELQSLEPDFDEVDDVLFLSFPSEEAMKAHIAVEKSLKWDKDSRALVGICRIIEFEQLKDESGKIKTNDARLHGLRGQHMRWKKYQRLFRQQVRFMRSRKGRMSSEGAVGRRRASSKTSDFTKIKGWRNKFDSSDLGRKKKGIETFGLEASLNVSEEEMGEGMDWSMADYEEPLYSSSCHGSDQEVCESRETDKVRWTNEHKRMMLRRRIFFRLHHTSPQEQYLLRKLGGQIAARKRKRKNGDLSEEWSEKNSVSSKPKEVKSSSKPSLLVEIDEEAARLAATAFRPVSDFAEDVDLMGEQSEESECLEDEDEEEVEMGEVVYETVEECLDNNSLEAEESDLSWRDNSALEQRCDKPGCRYGCICHLCSISTSADAEPDKDEAGKAATACDKEYCQLGCICDSLVGPVRKEPTSHCGNLDCMFECRCPVLSNQPSVEEALCLSKDDMDTCNDIPPLITDEYTLDPATESKAASSIPERESKPADGPQSRPKPVKTDRYSNLPRRTSTYRVAKNLDAVSRKAMMVYETSEIYCEKRKRKSTDVSPPSSTVAASKAATVAASKAAVASKASSIALSRAASIASSRTSSIALSRAAGIPSRVAAMATSKTASSKAPQPPHPSRRALAASASRSKSRSPKVTLQWEPVVISDDDDDDDDDNIGGTIEKLSSPQDNHGSSVNDRNQRRSSSSRLSSCSSPAPGSGTKDVLPDVPLEPSDLTSAVQQVCSPMLSDGPLRPPPPYPGHLLTADGLTAPDPMLRQQEKQSPSASMSSQLEHNVQTATGENLHYSGWHAQMVCLKSSTPVRSPLDQSIVMEEEMLLLEFISNCDWDNARPQVLSRLSSFLHNGAYPSPTKFSMGELEIEILPKADRPKEVPQEMNCNLPRTMYAIRVKVSLSNSPSGVTCQVADAAESEVGQTPTPEKHYDGKSIQSGELPGSSVPASLSSRAASEPDAITADKSPVPPVSTPVSASTSLASSTIGGISGLGQLKVMQSRSGLPSLPRGATVTLMSSSGGQGPPVVSAKESPSPSASSNKNSNDDSVAVPAGKVRRKKKSEGDGPEEQSTKRIKRKKVAKDSAASGETRSRMQPASEGSKPTMSLSTGLPGQFQFKLVQLPEGTQPGTMVHLLPTALGTKGYEKISQFKAVPLAALLQQGVKLPPMLKVASDAVGRSVAHSVAAGAAAPSASRAQAPGSSKLTTVNKAVSSAGNQNTTPSSSTVGASGTSANCVNTVSSSSMSNSSDSVSIASADSKVITSECPGSDPCLVGKLKGKGLGTLTGSQIASLIRAKAKGVPAPPQEAAADGSSASLPARGQVAPSADCKTKVAGSAASCQSTVPAVNRTTAAGKSTASPGVSSGASGAKKTATKDPTSVGSSALKLALNTPPTHKRPGTEAEPGKMVPIANLTLKKALEAKTSLASVLPKVPAGSGGEGGQEKAKLESVRPAASLEKTSKTPVSSEESTGSGFLHPKGELLKERLLAKEVPWVKKPPSRGQYVLSGQSTVAHLQTNSSGSSDGYSEDLSPWHVSSITKDSAHTLARGAASNVKSVLKNAITSNRRKPSEIQQNPTVCAAPVSGPGNKKHIAASQKPPPPLTLSDLIRKKGDKTSQSVTPPSSTGDVPPDKSTSTLCPTSKPASGSVSSANSAPGLAGSCETSRSSTTKPTDPELAGGKSPGCGKPAVGSKCARSVELQPLASGTGAGRVGVPADSKTLGKKTLPTASLPTGGASRMAAARGAMSSRAEASSDCCRSQVCSSEACTENAHDVQDTPGTGAGPSSSSLLVPAGEGQVTKLSKQSAEEACPEDGVEAKQDGLESSDVARQVPEKTR